VEYKEVFEAIAVLHAKVAEAKDNEPDDFNYGLLCDLDHHAQRILWHLTRGEEGEKNHLQLTLI
jgi:hypothetical protein